MFAGSIVAAAGCLVVLLGLGALHLVPTVGDDPLPGMGWPWRIDGAWAAAADLGPMFATCFGLSAATNAYLYQRTGVRSVRWPLALVAAIVGWLPLTGSRHGLIVVSGGLALAAVVVTARWWSVVPRRSVPWSRSLVAAVVLTMAVGLGAVSESYSALHPLAVRNSADTAAVTLRHGRSEMLRFEFENRGPLGARLDRIAVVNDPVQAKVLLPIEIASAQVPNGRSVAPTIAGLFKPFAPRRLSPGDSVAVYLTLSAAACRRRDDFIDLRLRAFDVRLRAAGRERTQRVRLQHDRRVRCSGQAD